MANHNQFITTEAHNLYGCGSSLSPSKNQLDIPTAGRFTVTGHRWPGVQGRIWTHSRVCSNVFLYMSSTAMYVQMFFCICLVIHELNFRPSSTIVKVRLKAVGCIYIYCHPPQCAGDADHWRQEFGARTEGTWSLHRGIHRMARWLLLANERRLLSASKDLLSKNNGVQFLPVSVPQYLNAIVKFS